jgi:hypothetical protein
VFSQKHRHAVAPDHSRAESHTARSVETGDVRRICTLVFLSPLRYQSPMPRESIDKLASALAEVVPAGLRSVGDDLEKNFKAVLKAGLEKMDLVSREEFEVQEAVLARTREILESMEARLADLETLASAAPAAKKRKKTSGKTAKKKVSKKKSAAKQ